MPKTMLSTDEIGGALVTYALEGGRIPKDAKIKDVTLHVDAGWGKGHHATIEWEPAKEPKK